MRLPDMASPPHVIGSALCGCWDGIHCVLVNHALVVVLVLGFGVSL